MAKESFKVAFQREKEFKEFKDGSNEHVTKKLEFKGVEASGITIDLKISGERDIIRKRLAAFPLGPTNAIKLTITNTQQSITAALANASKKSKKKKNLDSDIDDDEDADDSNIDEIDDIDKGLEELGIKDKEPVKTT
ncbi:MAG: hypothetical protein GF353_28705 [Candidatus Lokiarchaeota archaeon]|nr:hypothetical protein [Candidatus Lokiarchaeota archaeon]MBD3353983.1 hypothetical protein [Candidatus Lokiarchaeota archaeon]